MDESEETMPVDGKTFSMLRHDIRNQLSNIQLALEGLKYELPETEGEHTLYIDSMAAAAKKIDALLDNVG